MIFTIPQLFAAVAAMSGRCVLVHVPFEAAGGPKTPSADGTFDRAIGHWIISSRSPSHPVFLPIANILAEVVESLVLAVSVGDNAQFRRKCHIERFQFESDTSPKTERIFALPTFLRVFGDSGGT